MSTPHEIAASRDGVVPDLAVVVGGAPAVGRTSVFAAQHGHRDYVIRRMLAAADVCGIALALLVAAAVDSRSGHDLGMVLWGLTAIPIWIVLFKLYGLYELDAERVSHTTLDDIPRLFHAIAIGTLLVWLYLKGVTQSWPLQAVIGFSFTAMAAVLTLRSVARYVSVRVLGAERVLLVGEELMTRILVRKMRTHPEYGLAPVGVVAAGAGPVADLEVPVLGDIEDVVRLTEEHHIDRVILSQAELANSSALDIMRRCKELSVKVSLFPQAFDALGPSVEVDDVEGVTLLGINPPVLSRSSRYMKRALDIAGALGMTLLLAPVLAIIALAIKLDSSGPVFFRQSRVGKGGARFNVIKFRTMYSDAEERRAELLKDSMDPNWLHLADDPRITRVGNCLRLMSLDELPQLWNVLKGEMSLVGPRPLIEDEDRQVENWARSRLDLTPGITGSWQVLGRTSIPFEEMVKLDYLYVTNWSLWTDIRLILRTIPAVVTRRGAN